MDQAILKSVGGGASPTWRVRRLRLYAVLACLGTWQVIALSGLFYEGIVPPIQIVFVALVGELLDPEFYRHLSITADRGRCGLRRWYIDCVRGRHTLRPCAHFSVVLSSRT